MKRRLRARFRALTIAQSLLMLATCAALAWSLLRTDYLAVPAALGLLLAIQVYALIRTVEAHVETLEEFFAAIRYEDLTRRFVADDLDAELKTAFNRIIERFAEARAQRDLTANYLDTVVRHVPVPFIAARDDGRLTLVNNPARRLTGLPVLTNIDDLAQLDPELPRRLGELAPGQRALLQTRLHGLPAELRVSVSEIRMEGETERLYCLENLSGELSARESSAWRNLLRVLTHEIMNTLTPVTSLAQSCGQLLEDSDGNEDVREAIETIARRSEGLTAFVMRYRELMQIPAPQRSDVGVLDAFRAAVTLMRDEAGDVEFDVDVVPESLVVSADRNLLDQVLLNLLRNAVHALEGRPSPRVRLAGRMEYGRVRLDVVDNGEGIPEGVREQIFVPFFTTKRDGSGIGLSLSRQIMTAHGGEIAVESTQEGTTVSLVF